MCQRFYFAHYFNEETSEKEKLVPRKIQRKSMYIGNQEP